MRILWESILLDISVEIGKTLDLGKACTIHADAIIRYEGTVDISNAPNQSEATKRKPRMLV
jgi:hypothetical protein